MTPSKLKEARLALGLTQSQLADALGVNLSTVWRMEKGEIPIDRRTELAVLYLTQRGSTA